MTDNYKSNQIAYTRIKNKVVSTIKLPVVYSFYDYETMIYDPITGEFDDYQERHVTEESAIFGHIDAIRYMLKNTEEEIDANV